MTCILSFRLINWGIPRVCPCESFASLRSFAQSRWPLLAVLYLSEGNTARLHRWIPAGTESDEGQRVSRPRNPMVSRIRRADSVSLKNSRCLNMAVARARAHIRTCTRTYIPRATLHYTLEYEYTHRSNGHRLSAGRAAFSPAVALLWWTKTIGISRNLLEPVIRCPRNPQPNSSRCRFSTFPVPRFRRHLHSANSASRLAARLPAYRRWSVVPFVSLGWFIHSN